MKMKLVLTVIALIVAAGTAQAAGHYQIRDLGSVGYSGTYCTDINESSCAVGYGVFSNVRLWQPNGGMVDIPIPTGARYSDGPSINDRGQVVGGASYTDGGWGKAWIWYGSGNPTIINPLFGYQYSDANDINNNGVVVGISMNQGDWYHSAAYKWTSDDGMVRLNPLAGSPGSSAIAINDNGVVVGASAPGGTGDWQACMWDTDGTVRAIGPSTDYSCAEDINESGTVLMSANNPMHRSRSILWSDSLGSIDMGDLGGGSSTASGLNSKCEAVGWSYDSDSNTRAFYWSMDTGMVALPSLSQYIYYQATSINDDGIITGCAITNDRQFHAVLWEPVPEPTGILGLSTGLLSCIVWMRRKLA